MLRALIQTGLGKVFITVWSLGVIAFAGIGLAGAVIRDVAGSLALAVIVSGVLINMSVIVSYWVGSHGLPLARATWVFLALVALVALVAQLGAGKSDADIVMGYVIAVLSFPIGLLAEPIATSMKGSRDIVGLGVFWLVGMVAGYIQWFVLIPALMGATKTRGSDATL